MNELLLFLLGIAGVFFAACSMALLVLGVTIDRYPTGSDEHRTRSLSSPIESTRIAVIVFWVLFGAGTGAVLLEGRFFFIAGITTLFAASLFMLTSIIFSVAVLSTLKTRRSNILAVEREAAIQHAIIRLEKTAGVQIQVPASPEAKPSRCLSRSVLESLIRQY